MNAVRLLLSLGVLTMHFNIMTGSSIMKWAVDYVDIHVFFMLIGFLLFSSYENCTGDDFFVRRLKRIIPSYMIVVVMSAILLSFLSSLPASDYFSDRGTIAYLLSNISFLNFLSPDLPGVFDSGLHRFSAVNGSLWTIKINVVLYLCIPLLYKVGASCKRPARFYVAVFILAYIIWVSLLQVKTGCDLIPLKKYSKAVLYFFIGACLNVYLPTIMKYKWWVVLSFVLVSFTPPVLSNMLIFKALRPITTCVIVIAVIFAGKWGAIFRKLDVSYEIYLCHWPIIQVLISLGVLDGLGHWSSYFTVVVCTGVSSYLVAIFVSRRFGLIVKRLFNVVAVRGIIQR